MDEGQVVPLPPELRAKLEGLEVRGQGGFQDLVRDLKARLNPAGIRVDDKFVDRLEHYSYDFGRGGWQNLLREAHLAIERSGLKTA